MRVTEKLDPLFFPLPKVPLGTERVAWQLHSDDPTASLSSQGKTFCTLLHDSCAC